MMKKRKADKIISQLSQGYNSIAEHFNHTRYRLWPEMESWRDYLKNGEVVLDAGCGSGRLLELLTDFPDTSYYGFDNSVKLINIAQRNCQKYSLKSINFQVGNLLSLPYQNNFFSQVFCVATLQHIPSAAYRFQAVKEMYRVLKSGGRLFMTNWYFWNPSTARKYHISRQMKINWLYGLEKNDLLIPWKDKQQRVKFVRYYHAFSKPEMKKILENNGFVVEKNYLYSNAALEKKIWQQENLVTVARKV